MKHLKKLLIIFVAVIFPYCSSEVSKIKPSAPAPAMSIISLMSAHGCKNFADTLLSSPADKTFEDNVQGGLTIFCPSDDAMKSFSPKFKNLTAEGKQSVLEYHGIPVYQSLSSLRTSNGLMNTLATDGANNYNFVVQNDGQDVTLMTKIVTAKITGTVFDKEPVAIFSVDKVLEPTDLFKGAPTPAPAPAPAPAPTPDADAESPKSTGKKHKSPPAPASLADSPADKVAESKADKNVNRTEDALRVTQEMEQRRLVQDVATYSTIISGFCRNRELERAFCIKQQMVEKWVLPDVITYSSLIQGLCEQQSLTEACELNQLEQGW